MKKNLGYETGERNYGKNWKNIQYDRQNTSTNLNIVIIQFILIFAF